MCELLKMNYVPFEEFKSGFEKSIKNEYSLFNKLCRNRCRSELPLEYDNAEQYLQYWKPLLRLQMLNAFEEEREKKPENMFAVVNYVCRHRNGLCEVRLYCISEEEPVDLSKLKNCITGLSFEPVDSKSCFNEMIIACDENLETSASRQLDYSQICELINDGQVCSQEISESENDYFWSTPVNLIIDREIKDLLKPGDVVYMNVLASFYLPMLHDRNLDRMASCSIFEDHFLKPKVNVEINIPLTDSQQCPTHESFTVLNKFQEDAVNKVLTCMEDESQENIVQILGPPGSGKTQTIVGLLERVFETYEESRVLVCTSSNSAIDVIALRTQASSYFEQTGHDLNEFGFLFRFGMLNKINPLVKSLKPDSITEYHEASLGSCIVFSTLDSCQPSQLSLSNGGPGLMDFDLVIIDEAAQCSDVQILMAFAHDCRTFVMFGDHKQLKPVIKPQLCARLGYERSFFERYQIIKDQAGDKSTVGLWKQYRMRHKICEFSSKHFYDGMMKTARNAGKNFMINLPPLTFFDVENSEEHLHKNGFGNFKEVEFIAHLVEGIFKRPYINQSFLPNVGIICFYKTQIGLMVNRLRKKNFLKGNNIRVDTVDSFQGQERDIIIISCSRSNFEQNIGFLESANRLNVAITRAKTALILVGHAETLNTNSMWSQFIVYLNQKKRFFSVSSDTNNFKPFFNI